MNIGTCGDCGYIAVLIDGVICEGCDIERENATPQPWDNNPEFEAFLVSVGFYN